MPQRDPFKKGFTLDEFKQEQPGNGYRRHCRYCKNLVHSTNSIGICPDCYVQQVGSALNGKEDLPHEDN